MREDYLGGHAAEDKGHGEAEEHEMVVWHERRVRAVKPGADGERVDGHGRPLHEYRQDRQFGRSSGFDDIDHAEGDVGAEEGGYEDRDPEVAHGVAAKPLVVAEEVVVAYEIGDLVCPDIRSVVAGRDHEQTSDDEAFSWPVENSEIQSMRMVCFPGGEEHRQAWDKCGENTCLRSSQSHSCSFA